MLKNVSYGAAAGLCICLGGGVFLMCENRLVGSFLFAVALLSICHRGYYLYTGKVCYLIEDHSRGAWELLVGCLLGNILATVLGALLIGAAIPALRASALTLCEGKLSSQTPLQTFLRGFLCGLPVYLAVSIYRDHKAPEGVIYCVPVFIFSGYEHSIADIFYFAAAGQWSGESLRFLLLVLLGNSLGGLCLPLLESMGKEKTHG